MLYVVQNYTVITTLNLLKVLVVFLATCLYVQLLVLEKHQQLYIQNTLKYSLKIALYTKRNILIIKPTRCTNFPNLFLE